MEDSATEAAATSSDRGQMPSLAEFIADLSPLTTEADRAAIAGRVRPQVFSIATPPSEPGDEDKDSHRNATNQGSEKCDIEDSSREQLGAEGESKEGKESVMRDAARPEPLQTSLLSKQSVNGVTSSESTTWGLIVL